MSLGPSEDSIDYDTYRTLDPGVRIDEYNVSALKSFDDHICNHVTLCRSQVPKE